MKLTPTTNNKKSHSILTRWTLIMLILLFFNSCQEDEPKPTVLPTVTTTAVSNVASVSASSGGSISSDGGGLITARGVVWSTNTSPTTALITKTTDGTGTDTFISNLTGLSSNTKYYVRAYATNSAGTSYGNEQNFTSASTSNVILTPPFSLNLNSFYKKYLDASGVPVISSDKVPDLALYSVQKTVNKMVSHRSDVLAKMIDNKIRVGIMAKTEVTTDMPEHGDLNIVFPQTDWNQYRGLGATTIRPLSSCAEENVLCHENDPYFNEDILIHEFAHGIHYLGIRFVDANIDTELQQAFNSAVENGLWADTYAGSNYIEYFAEGVQDWFNVNAESIPANGIHNQINTREELKNYDITLYNILKRYFKDDDEMISCHQ